LIRYLGTTLAFLLAERFGLLVSPWVFALGEVLLLVSVLSVLLRPAAALLGYRFAVHATTLALCGLAQRLLGTAGTWAAIAVGIVLVERAFFFSDNP
jgi:hypothetical protein